mgnify:FL=1
MIITPTFYRVFRIIEKGKQDKVKTFFYDNKGELLCSGEFYNLSPEEFDDLKNFLDCLIKINNTNETSLVFGIVELQHLLEKWSK